MKKVYVPVLGAVAALLLLGASNALAGRPNVGTCSGGAITPGTYDSYSVTGHCTLVSGTLNVNGNLDVADGAYLDAVYKNAVVNVGGNVKVGKGAILGIGCAFFVSDCGLPGPVVFPQQTVGGNIIANQPLTIYLDHTTVQGNVVSNGGGPGTSEFLNFAVKDNTINGNLIMQGWQGGWIGAIRNNVGGNLNFSDNASVVTDDGSTPPDSDSSEVTSNTVGGNLICQGNSPSAQIGDVPGGHANAVGGNKIGECAGL
jgi:hypothetical protein